MPERDDEYGGLLMQVPMLPLPVETCPDPNASSAIADSQTRASAGCGAAPARPASPPPDVPGELYRPHAHPTLLEIAVTDSTDYPFAATVHRPGLPDVHIGFPFKFQAEHACASLDQDLVGTSHVEGTTITSGPTPDGITPLPPLPADALALSMLISEDDGALPMGHGFPDLFARLKAQEGYEAAARIWADALDWLDDDEPEDSG